MMTHHELRITNYASRTTQYAIMLLALVLASCTSAQEPSPRILAVEPAGVQVARYEKLELTIALEAVYDNPYDARQVDLTAVFTGPDGREWPVPGFWDGDKAWRVRFRTTR